MPSSVLNSDDGVISGTSGIKAVGGDDGVLVFQSKGTETARINTDKQIVAAAGTASLPVLTTTGDVNTGIYFPAADNIGFATGGTIRGRWTTDGLCFGSDTAAANALDDYEEGTWTPVIAFGGASAGVTYNARRVGVYTKIGNMVVINCFLAPTNVGSSTGTCTVTGLPFQAAATGQAGTGGLMINGVTNDGNTIATVDTNSQIVDFYTTATNGTRRNLTKNDVTNNDEFAFTVIYFT